MAKSEEQPTVSTVTALKRPVNANVVETLKETLAAAERGEITGIVMLWHTPSTVERVTAGYWDGAAILYSVECWKHSVLHQWQGI